MRKVHSKLEQTEQTHGVGGERKREREGEGERRRKREGEAITDADRCPSPLGCRWISQVAASVLSRLRTEYVNLYVHYIWTI